VPDEFFNHSKNYITMRKLKIIAGSSHQVLAEKIADKLNIQLTEIEKIRFENDNLLYQIKENVRACDVFFIQTTRPPVQEIIFESLMVINALKHASAVRITSVLPYFPYARSDKKDQSRICITARLVADLLETAGSNRVLTMDLHSPQIQGFFSTPCDQLIATKTIFNYLHSQKDLTDYVLVSADVGKSKTLSNYSKLLNLPLAIVDKRRIGNSDDIIPTHLIGDVEGKNALIVDDEIASGNTLCKSAQFLVEEKGAKKVIAAAVHPVFTKRTIENLNNSPIEELIVTDTIPLGIDKKSCTKTITVLSVASLFADAIQRIHNGDSVSDLF
jgi:ribose-phosphate pyrophosphokinase